MCALVTGVQTCALPIYMKDLLKERERGEEAEHFRREDAKLIEKMRERAHLDEIARALAAKLRVDDAELLRRDRQSVVEGKSVSVRVDLGGRRLLINKK